VIVKNAFEPGVLHRLIEHRTGEVREKRHPETVGLQRLQRRERIRPCLQLQIALHQLIAV
jgi:hypothetical protein